MKHFKELSANVPYYTAPIALLESPRAMRNRYRLAWLRDMEQGRYRQIRYHLIEATNSGRFMVCALGAAALTAGFSPSELEDDDGNNNNADPICDFYAIKNASGIIAMNDSDGYSLPKIAGFIRDQWNWFFYD